MNSADGTAADRQLDETLEATFPASDAPANTPETGIQVGADRLIASGFVVRDNRNASRFEVVFDGQIAFLEYERRTDAFVILHTEVPESARRRGIGSLLARTALQAARAEGFRPVVRCPFVRSYLRKHPEWSKNR